MLRSGEEEYTMTHIVLTDEQAKTIAAATKPVAVCDSAGNILGFLNPKWTEADIAEALKALAADEPWYTTDQVLAHLRSLGQK
jgi:hypothetical protein